MKHREIPFERRGERVVFRKRDIDMWASQRILRLSEQRLAASHEKSTRGLLQMLPRSNHPAGNAPIGSGWLGAAVKDQGIPCCAIWWRWRKRPG